MSISGTAVDDARRTLEVLRPYVSGARQRKIEEVLAARTRAVTVVLEDLVSDHNGAAVLRTADAMGLMEVHVIPLATGFRVSRKVALGAQKWLETRRYPSVQVAYAALRRRGFEVWASTVHGGAASIAEVPDERPVALVFGNEHSGLSDRASALADGCFRLPMYGFAESFNISVATSLALYDVVQRRRQTNRLCPLSEEDQLQVRARWYARSVRASSQLLARAGLALAPELGVDLVDDEEDP